jgi:hypothetical protein
MVYSPQLSERASTTLRSFSYVLGKPMTKALDRAIELLPIIIHPVLVCQKCRDKTRCAICGFNMGSMPPDIKPHIPPQA